MTGAATTRTLQWGPHGGVPPGITTPVGVTFHLPPGTPLWVVVKAAVWLTGWTGAPPRGYRRARWTTLVGTTPPQRWATGAALVGTNFAATTGAVAGLYRPEGYDLARWRITLRGAGPTGGEGHLLRRRYV